jgi:hypothetical protein
LSEQEHDLMLSLSMEEQHNAAKGNEGKYDHEMLTTQYIPNVEFYMLYKTVTQRLIHEKV